MDNLWRYAEIETIDMDNNLLTLRVNPKLISHFINPSGVIKLSEVESVIEDEKVII